MVIRAILFGILFLVATNSFEARAQSIQQYKAAVTKIFLWRYLAFPIYRQNPIVPGDVI